MKKLLLIIYMLLIVPVQVRAMEVTDEFKVSDKVAVFVAPKDRREFHVIKPSKSGEEYVWMIYNGYVEPSNGDNGITVFDEDDNDNEATSVFEDALIYSYFTDATNSWTNANVKRLLKIEDLADLGIKVGSSGDYEILGNRIYMMPIVTELTKNMSEAYNYWTQSADTSKENTSVYAVIKNENHDGSSFTPVAYVKSFDISDPVNNSLFTMRPVIQIHKKYIDCLLDVVEETTAPPATSEVKIPYEIVGGLVIIILGYVFLEKKKLFQKI